MNRAIAVSFLVMAACAPQRVPVNAVFDPQEAAFIQRSGNGVITGQAFMRQLGGNVVTCAGETMYLIPVTRYSTERIQIIYGNTQSGRSYVGGPVPIDAPPEYSQYQKTSTCDAQGNFRFDQVPPGEYYLVGRVIWAAGSSPQGGSQMRRVRVAPGQTQTVLLSS